MISQIKNSAALVALSAATSVLALPTQLTSRAVQASTDLCGKADYIILNNSPWIVYNMMYNADVTVGTQCTYYDSMVTASDGTAEVKWNSETDITYVESTNNVPKGYSFVGLTQNLENTLTSIASIPATYTWTRTNTTAFKGNICFDFMTNDVKGDSTSSSSQELMLWLEYTGGQLPIGWTAGSVATIDDLFGTSWDLYQGVNDDTGITVSSLLPKTMFEGTFEGDLREWFMKLVGLGLFTEGTYVNVGNAGTEMFYGNAIMNATLGLQIDLGTATTTAKSAVVATSAVISSSSTQVPVASSTILSTPVIASSSSSVLAEASSTATSSTSVQQPTSSSVARTTASSTKSSKHHVATPVAPLKEGSTIAVASIVPTSSTVSSVSAAQTAGAVSGEEAGGACDV